MISTIRFNLALPGQDPEQNALRHQAMLDIANRADAAGLTAISLEEHHGVTHDGQSIGWCASPMTLAAAILARTSTLMVGVWGLALPLHDPLRVAEDIATIDLLAPGRVILTVTTGYRPIEFAAHDVDYERRAEIFERKVSLLKQAWLGEPITKGDDHVVVTPRPATQPHPMLLAGGASEADAVLAARTGLPFRPSAHHPDLRAAYEAACADSDATPMYLAPGKRVALVQVADDPDRWWSLVGEHLLLEARMYSSWMQPGDHSAVHSQAQTVEELRTDGVYQVLTPDQAIAAANADGSILLHPFGGGTPLELAEQTAELFIDKVLPHLT